MKLVIILAICLAGCNQYPGMADNITACSKACNVGGRAMVQFDPEHGCICATSKDENAAKSSEKESK